MEKDKLIRMIQDEIENASERKMRYTLYLQHELEIIKKCCEYKDFFSAGKSIKAHSDMIESHRHTILEQECKLDVLEWQLDEIEKGGNNE